MSTVKSRCRECDNAFTQDEAGRRKLCDACRLKKIKEREQTYGVAKYKSTTKDKVEAQRGYSIADLQWSNPDRFARQVNSITSGIMPLCGTTKNPSPMEEILDIHINDPLHEKDVTISCDAALVVYVKCDHSIRSGMVGSLELLERLKKFAAMNPSRLFGSETDEVRWFCRLPLEPTSMKNSKINGRWLSVEARKFKKDAISSMKADGVWQVGKQFSETDLIGMTCYVRYSSFRKDMDLELVKDCLQLAGIIPNDKMIFGEDFNRDPNKGTPEILVTLRKIGTAAWK